MVLIFIVTSKKDEIAEKWWKQRNKGPPEKAFPEITGIEILPSSTAPSAPVGTRAAFRILFHIWLLASPRSGYIRVIDTAG